MQANIIEVNESTFEQQVLARSADVPVVVDFWASWCGPCRTLGPLLERLAQDSEGQWILAKVDVDQNPQLSMRYRVQGIPAVKGFRDGKLVAEFVGAVPEPTVRQFLKRLLPSEADQLAKQGESLLAAGNPHVAEELFRRVLAAQSDHPVAVVGLTQILTDQQQWEEAEALLDGVVLTGDFAMKASQLRAKLTFGRAAAELGSNRAEFEARLQANPADLEIAYALGNLDAVAGNYRAALERFLNIVRINRRYQDGAARKAMLQIFELLGDEHPLTDEFRPLLASALF